MGHARKHQICLDETSYYHTIARCVRRAWLWGYDEYADRDYSHRKSWVLERLQQVSSAYAIDPCSYVVMANHYHLVLHVDRARAREWPPAEVVNRWGRLQRIPSLVQHWQDGSAGKGERLHAEEIIEGWRDRLTDVSWYMRHINEHLARRANAEDECTGRFWEGRFKSQALLDEQALLTAMVYVDLNPLRAGIAVTPEESDFTSIHERIRWIQREAVSTTDSASGSMVGKAKEPAAQPPKVRNRKSKTVIAEALPLPRVELLDFYDRAAVKPRSLPFAFQDYLEVLDWTARQLQPGKHAMSDRTPPILGRLKVDLKAFQLAMRPRR